MDQGTNPLVSIGLPVFNGENHLAITIAAILNQTYPNLEIVISDNCSTDETESIARKAASSDQRIKYVRNPTNIGIFRNFNRTLQESSGEFFMWAAHDDFHSPSFVEECANLMLVNPGAIMCQTRVAVCLERLERVIYFSTLNSFVDATSAWKRYRETLYNFPAVAIYGLYRAETARTLPGLRIIPGGDLLWIQELALHGDFIQSNKTLFSYIARAEWNSFESDLKNLDETDTIPGNSLHRAFAAFSDRRESISRTNNSRFIKLRLLLTVVRFTTRTVLIRGLLRVFGLISKGEVLDPLKRRIYWRFLHNPNIEIFDSELFEKRVINPTLGIK